MNLNKLLLGILLSVGFNLQATKFTVHNSHEKPAYILVKHQYKAHHPKGCDDLEASIPEQQISEIVTSKSGSLKKEECCVTAISYKLNEEDPWVLIADMPMLKALTKNSNPKAHCDGHFDIFLLPKTERIKPEEYKPFEITYRKPQTEQKKSEASKESKKEIKKDN